MGLIKAAQAATGTVMADQWKEFFYCDSLDNDTLLVRGKKRTGSRSSNTNGNDNIISNGSGIAVADGQCMLIVDQGKIAEVCAEPGEYTYDTSSEPSIFAGNLSDSIKNTFLTIGKRFSYGGDTGKDQRVYYINTKEITDNKFGTANPVWFRVVDKRINLDKDIEIRCNGVYSFKITNPLLFYTSLSGNVADCYEKSEIMPQLKTEFIDALQPAFAKIAEMEIRPSQIPAHATEIGDAMNEILTKKWSEIRGLSIVSVAFNPVTLKEEDAEAIRQAQNTSMYTDPSMMAATLGMAQAEAMKNAASNPNGAMMGFMGMNMASGGMNIQGLYDQGAAQKQAQKEQQVQKEQNQVNGQNPQAGNPKNLQNKAAAPQQVERHRPGLVPVVRSTMADSVSSVVSQNHRQTIAGLAVVERSTKENSAWSAANRNHRNYTIAAINVAGNRKILQILRNSVRSAEIRLQMTTEFNSHKIA